MKIDLKNKVFYTFMLPFYLENEGKKENIKELIEKNDGIWKRETLNDYAVFACDDNDDLVRHKENVYFHDYALNILGLTSDTSDNKCTYRYLRKLDKGTIWKIYDSPRKSKNLDIINVELLVHDLGDKKYNLGLLKINTSYERKSIRSSTFDEVKEIAEYARRVYFPYRKDDGSCDLLAKKQELKSGKNILSSWDIINDVNDDIANSDLVKNPIIKWFLFGNDVRNDIGVYSFLDDRMFTSIYIQNYNKSIATKIKKFNFDCKDDEFLREIYSLIYIDKSQSDCSARNRELLIDNLKESLYTRWTEYGTLYGITNFSMVSILSGNPIEHLVESCLNTYNSMAIITLFERAKFIFLHNKVTVNGEKDDDKLYEVMVDTVTSYNTEITEQLQGIEMFKIFQYQFGLKENFDLLLQKLQLECERQKNKTNRLKLEASEKDKETRENIKDVLALGSGVSMLVSVTKNFNDIYDEVYNGLWWISFALICTFVILTFVVYIGSSWFKKNNNATCLRKVATVCFIMFLGFVIAMQVLYFTSWR